MPDKQNSSLFKKAASRAKLVDVFMRCLLFLCGCASIVITLGIVLVLMLEAFAFFQEVSIVEFFTSTQWTPLFADKNFGIAPLVFGTLLTSFIAILLALPIGLLIAIYLSEYASESSRKIIKPIMEVLAGIPTIVYGFFALFTLTPFLQIFIPNLSGFNALSAGLVMGLMILPMVASLSEDALYAVPVALKEGAYAMGASRLQMIFHVLVPAALGGITAAVILAVSRAVGETMIVAIAAGQQASLTLNPLEPIQTMTAYIVQVSLGDTPHGTLEYKTIFAVGTLLFFITLALNLISLYLRNRFKRAYT
jgi:phosphate transport system permease protein